MQDQQLQLQGIATRLIREISNLPKNRGDHRRKGWLAPSPLSDFRSLEPVGFGLSFDRWVFHHNDATPDLVWPLNIATIANGGTGDDRLGLSIMRVTSVSPREARGHAIRFSPFMVRQDIAYDFGGELQRHVKLFAWLGGKWVAADASSITNTRETDGIGVLITTALRQRYEWAVSVGFDNTPSIRFATDAEGIKELFKVRDLPVGRDRRDPLLNWVSNHWRQNRRDRDVESYVRKHLRGATTFTSRGMNVEILPAQFDVEARDALIAERADMRASGEDRRKRA